VIIEDGRGSGKKAGVDSDNRLAVNSRSESLQHFTSHEEEQAYQVLTLTSITAGASTAITHIKNLSSERDMVITYIRHQILGNIGTIPSIDGNGNYFLISAKETYSSGGVIVEPINIKIGSGNESGVQVYTDNPIIAGVGVEVDRFYTQNFGDMNVLNKEGALIVKPQNTLSTKYISDDVEGVLYTRISFLMKIKED